MMESCPHPSHEVIEATLAGVAWGSFVVGDGVSTGQMATVLYALYCTGCVMKWAGKYSDHCVLCACAAWIETAPGLSVRQIKIDNIAAQMDVARRSWMN